MSGVMVPPDVAAVEVETTVSNGRATVATASESWHSKASPVAAMTSERLLESAAASCARAVTLSENVPLVLACKGGSQTPRSVSTLSTPASAQLSNALDMAQVASEAFQSDRTRAAWKAVSPGIGATLAHSRSKVADSTVEDDVRPRLNSNRRRPSPLAPRSPMSAVSAPSEEPVSVERMPTSCTGDN